MKVSIIGVGNVGSSLGLALVAQGLVDELLLVGRRREHVAAEAADLLHASAFGRPVQISAGEIADTADSDAIVLCVSGKPSKDTPFHHRNDHLHLTVNILREIVPLLAKLSPKTVFIVTTNPLDVMTTLTWQLSDLPWTQVLGSGTLLDTMRLRVLLSQRCEIHPMDLRAYVLGEHGDSQFAALHSASSGGAKLPLTEKLIRKLAGETRRAGIEIAQGKGYTNHGVAFAAAFIIRAIALDSREVIPVSHLLRGNYGIRDVCLSLPAVIGASGIQKTLQIELTTREKELLKRSARTIKAALKKAVHDGA